MNWLSKSWTAVKEWFSYSQSILIARLEVLAGFIIGVFSFIDWSAFTSIDFTGITSSQLGLIALGLVIKGVISEMARRMNTVDVPKVGLLPTQVAVDIDAVSK